jgi:hypothetical protein
MNLGQAYQGWQQMEENRELYIKTREAFRKAWFQLPTNKPCSYYTKEVLGNALAATYVIESFKAKAASVMIHVLNFANWAEPKFNPKPDFTFEDLMEYTKGPKREVASAPEQIAPVSDITLDAIKVREKAQMTEIEIEKFATLKPLTPCDEHGNPIEGSPSIIISVPESIEVSDDSSEDPLAGISFDDDNNEEETKTEMNMEEKKKRGKQPKPVAQIDATTYQVIKVWPSMTEAEAELGIYHIAVAISKLRKAGGFYWSLPADADTFKERLDEKMRQTGERQKPTKPATKKPAMKKVDQRVADLEQVALPSKGEERNAVKDALAVFSDDELMEELDRRGWEGELSRRQIVTIGAKA